MARRIQLLSGCLPAAHFPEVISRQGEALLIEWVDGTPLDPSEIDLALLRECGALQALVHGVRTRWNLEGIRPVSREDERTRLRLEILDLVVPGGLSEAEARNLFELASARIPPHAEAGLIHRDFCADNLLLESSGQLCVVDNETLVLGAYDYDLARTWYRWPMTMTEREAYLEGYEQHRSAQAFRSSFTYWLIRAVIDSALYRFRHRMSGREIPIQRLKGILKGHERELPPGRGRRDR